MDESSFDLQLISHFFEAETCRELISEMRHASGSAAVTYGKSSAASVESSVRKAVRVTPSIKTIAFVTRQLELNGEAIGRHFGIALGNCEEPQFLRYRVGDFFVAHQDGNTGLIQLDSDRSRRVSVSIFLNGQVEDGEEGSYSGGSLVFSDWRNGKTLELRAEAGQLVAFRSELTHEVTPVKTGERYSIVTWYGARSCTDYADFTD